jgi:hypothetical protein
LRRKVPQNVLKKGRDMINRSFANQAWWTVVFSLCAVVAHLIWVSGLGNAHESLLWGVTLLAFVAGLALKGETIEDSPITFLFWACAGAAASYAVVPYWNPANHFPTVFVVLMVALFAALSFRCHREFSWVKRATLAFGTPLAILALAWGFPEVGAWAYVAPLAAALYASWLYSKYRTG